MDPIRVFNIFLISFFLSILGTPFLAKADESNKIISFPLENLDKNFPYSHSTSNLVRNSPIIDSAKQLLVAQRLTKLPSVTQALVAAVEEKQKHSHVNALESIIPKLPEISKVQKAQEISSDFHEPDKDTSHLLQHELNYLPTYSLGKDSENSPYPELEALADQVIDLIAIIMQEQGKTEEQTYDKEEFSRTFDGIIQLPQFSANSTKELTFGDVAYIFNYPKEKLINALLKAAPAIFKQLHIPPMEDSYAQSIEMLASFFVPLLDQLQFMDDLLANIKLPVLVNLFPEKTELDGWYEGIMKQFISIVLKINDDSEQSRNVTSPNWLGFTNILEETTKELNNQFLYLLSQKIGDLANSALELHSQSKSRSLRGSNNSRLGE